MTALAPTLNDKYNEKFFEQLAEKLEELFPKLNIDNPEIKSPNHRSEAITLNAFANIIFRNLLIEYTQEIIKMYKLDKRPSKRRLQKGRHMV